MIPVYFSFVDCWDIIVNHIYFGQDNYDMKCSCCPMPNYHMCNINVI